MSIRVPRFSLIFTWCCFPVRTTRRFPLTVEISSCSVGGSSEQQPGALLACQCWTFRLSVQGFKLSNGIIIRQLMNQGHVPLHTPVLLEAFALGTSTTNEYMEARNLKQKQVRWGDISYRPVTDRRDVWFPSMRLPILYIPFFFSTAYTHLDWPPPSYPRKEGARVHTTNIVGWDLWQLLKWLV